VSAIPWFGDVSSKHCGGEVFFGTEGYRAVRTRGLRSFYDARQPSGTFCAGRGLKGVGGDRGAGIRRELLGGDATLSREMGGTQMVFLSCRSCRTLRRCSGARGGKKFRHLHRGARTDHLECLFGGGNIFNPGEEVRK